MSQQPAGQVAFTYFPDYRRWARFVDEPCDCAGPCLNGLYFEDPDVPDAVCLERLISGAVRVAVPAYLRDTLARSAAATHPGWPAERLAAHVAAAVDTLSRTPPVPWVQHNSWPVHHGDFCCYLGEWDQAALTAASPTGDGRAYLLSLVEAPPAVADPEALWVAVGSGWATVFGFACLTCGHRVAVVQSY